MPLIPAPSRGLLHSFLARIKAYRAKTFTSLKHNFDPPGRGTLPAALSAQQAHPHMLSANPALESLILWHVQLPAFQVPKSVPLFPSKNGFAWVCPDSICVHVYIAKIIWVNSSSNWQSYSFLPRLPVATRLICSWLLGQLGSPGCLQSWGLQIETFQVWKVGETLRWWALPTTKVGSTFPRWRWWSNQLSFTNGPKNQCVSPRYSCCFLRMITDTIWYDRGGS